MLLAAETTEAAGGGAMGMGFTVVWMVALFAIMYFMMIRPQ